VNAGFNPGRWRPRLADTLDLIIAAALHFRDEWWVIGSAAAALSGAEIAEIGDVDLLLSETDAQALRSRWSVAPLTSPAPSDQFRSAVFFRCETGPLAIEAFGGFEMRVRGLWRPVKPLTRVERGAVFTPSLAEQIALLEAMGREKDSIRIEALRAHLCNRRS